MVSIRVTVSLPKTDFASKKWLDSIARVQRTNSVPVLRKLFKETVFGWSRKPDFGWSQSKSASEITIRMYPTGPNAEIWALVSAGAPRHTIQPQKPNGILSFRPGYRSATKPGTLKSSRAYRSGKPVIAKVVDHPGFEGRNFPELIAQKFADDFGMDMQAAINKVANE